MSDRSRSLLCLDEPNKLRCTSKCHRWQQKPCQMRRYSCSPRRWHKPWKQWRSPTLWFTTQARYYSTTKPTTPGLVMEIERPDETMGPSLERGQTWAEGKVTDGPHQAKGTGQEQRKTNHGCGRSALHCFTWRRCSLRSAWCCRSRTPHPASPPRLAPSSGSCTLVLQRARGNIWNYECKLRTTK